MVCSARETLWIRLPNHRNRLKNPAPQPPDTTSPDFIPFVSFSTALDAGGLGTCKLTVLQEQDFHLLIESNS